MERKIEQKTVDKKPSFAEDPKSRLSESTQKIKRKLERGVDLAKTLKEAVKDSKEHLKEDIRITRKRDPAARSDREVLLLYSGVHAMAAYRVAHGLHQKGYYFGARAISQAARMITGIEIHPGAKIGKGLMIDHGMGVVIGETTEIGDYCTLYQGVTLGGTGKDVGKRHPTLGNNVLVGAGAKVLGPFTIGDNTKIAANAVVLAEIPEACTAVGIPAKVVKKEGVRIEDDMDQIHIPDPVSQELKRLEEKLAALEQELAELKQKEKTDKKKK